MGLGRHLVRELDLEDGVDTLGRWMAHHLAGLIHAAEHAETPDERATARAEATETIIRIWEHRSSLPGRAYPLAPNRDILAILQRLRIDNNPFRFVGRAAESELDRLSERIFDGLARLVITLLLMKLPSTDHPARVDDAAVKALDRTERHVFELLQEWGELIVSNENRAESSSIDGASGKAREEVLRDNAAQLVEKLSVALSELRGELGSGNAETYRQAPKPAPD